MSLNPNNPNYGAPSVRSEGVVRVLMDKYTQAENRASFWSTHWENIRKLVRPNTKDFWGNSTKGNQRHDEIYDGSAPWALEQLTAGLHSNLVSPAERWFQLGVVEAPLEKLPRDLVIYLEQLSDYLYHFYSRPESNHTAAMHETFSDVGGFGTAVTFMYFNKFSRTPVFRSYPLACCMIDENYDGEVDTVHRSIIRTKRQILQNFPQAILSDKIAKAKDDEEFTVIHSVFPAAEYDPTSPFSFPYRSYYWLKDDRHVLSEGGFRYFPYLVPRWVKVAGEIYGRSPAMSCLPDIRLLNIMMKELIMSAQLSNRPPIILDEDGFTLPVSYKPGSMIIRAPGTQDPVQLQAGNNFNITLEIMDQKREHIARSFYVDWLLRPKKKERQTTVEIMDDRDEMLRQLSPMLGRMEKELLGPMIRNTLQLLSENRMLPPAPESAQGYTMDIKYISPAAESQVSSKAVNLQRFLQDFIPLMQADPTVIDTVDIGDVAQQFASYRRVSKTAIRDPKQVEQIREQRAQQEQQQLATEQMGGMASALKDVATAQEKGLGVV